MEELAILIPLLASSANFSWHAQFRRHTPPFPISPRTTICTTFEHGNPVVLDITISPLCSSYLSIISKVNPYLLPDLYPLTSTRITTKSPSASRYWRRRDRCEARNFRGEISTPSTIWGSILVNPTSINVLNFSK